MVTKQTPDGTVAAAIPAVPFENNVIGAACAGPAAITPIAALMLTAATRAAEYRPALRVLPMAVPPLVVAPALSVRVTRASATG
jgi:hypothetical protein